MKEKFKQIMDKFNQLPPAAKIAIAAGGGLGLYWLFNADRKNTASSVEALSEGTVIYPYAVSPDSEYTSGSSGGSNYSSFDTSDLVTIDQFSEWANVTAESIASLQSQNKALQNDMLAAPAGVAPIAQPQQTISLTPNQQLQKAQAAYGAAKTKAEKDAAAAAGQAARAAGATDTGAAAIWKATSTKKTNSSPPNTTNANQQLQKAQAAYGAAKTKAEKDAAAAAGKAARAAGATDTGAAEIWQSLKK